MKLYRVVKSVPSALTRNTVPLPELPPPPAVPYSVLPDETKQAYGLAPSLPSAKSYRAVKPVPLVLTENTVPKPQSPPHLAVPYKVLPDKIKPAYGKAP